MSGPICIDLLHLGLDGAIACYLLDAEEPTIVDPGPTTTVDRLCEQFGELGVGPNDLRHVMLTHIHLDHAGGVGHLLERFPSAIVHVHEDGASHMVDPERLVASTRRTFGDRHDRLWGEVKPVPADRIRAWTPGEPGPWDGLRPELTPGHISHHVAYLDERDGTLFGGDSLGIVLPGAPPYPATPAPGVDLRAWHRTLDKISEMAPERFGATHFGLRSDVEACRLEYVQRLEALEERVRAGLEAGDDSDSEVFGREIREELTPHMGDERAAQFFDMFPASTDWAGVAFYLERNT